MSRLPALRWIGGLHSRNSGLGVISPSTDCCSQSPTFPPAFWVGSPGPHPSCYPSYPWPLSDDFKHFLTFYVPDFENVDGSWRWRFSIRFARPIHW